MKKIRIGIIGGAGYTGGELIRLLVNHPNAEIVFINSNLNGAKKKVTADFGATEAMVSWAEATEPAKPAKKKKKEKIKTGK